MQENLKLRSYSNESMVGKIVLVRKDFFSPKYREGDRRFRVSGGFGAEPGKIGRAVFGTFLSDGEEARIDRGDVAGILEDQSA